MRLALLQTRSPQGDTEWAMDQIAWALRAAGAFGADMLTLPEVFLPGYNQPEMVYQPQDGAWAARLRLLCAEAGCGLTIGYAEVAGADHFNSAMVIGADGAMIAHYRKIQLYGAREAMMFRAGDAYCTFDLGGQRAAVLICYDIEFAPHVAALAAQGVTLILVPTANMQPFSHVVRHTVPAMAAAYGVSIVYANYCGQDNDLDYVGGSLIVGRDGAVLAQAGGGTALLMVDLPDFGPQTLSTQALDFRPIA